MAQVSKARKEAGMKEIREPAVAGSWSILDSPIPSPGISKDISKMPRREKIEGEIVALVSPHAGYVYSGQVAAYAYKLIEGKSFDTVVVVAPSHYVHFKGVSRSGIGEDTGPLSGWFPSIRNSPEDDGEMKGDSVSS